MKKVVRLTEKDLTRIVKRVIAEQEEGDYKRGIQCFLNKRGIKDDSGQSLKIDGNIDSKISYLTTKWLNQKQSTSKCFKEGNNNQMNSFRMRKNG